MGYMKHNAIVVTSWNEEHIDEARRLAIETFNHYLGAININLVGEIIISNTNSEYSFFIAPDGSKEGCGTSVNGDTARNELFDIYDKSDLYIDYIDIRFGGDDVELENIARSKKNKYENETS